MLDAQIEERQVIRWTCGKSKYPGVVAWGPVKVESGRTEGRVMPRFLVQDELGNAESPAKGIELLKIDAIKKKGATSD